MENEYNIWNQNGLRANTPGYDSFGNPIVTNPYQGIPINYNIGNETVNTKLNLGDNFGFNPPKNNTSSWWDSTKDGVNWLVGNKDSSPLGYIFRLGEGYLNYKNAKDNLKFQKQQHQDQMDFARYNALADINADMANANMQLLRWQGFNPERASEYANSFYNSFQDIAKQAESIGIPADSINNGLKQLNELANRDK